MSKRITRLLVLLLTGLLVTTIVGGGNVFAAGNGTEYKRDKVKSAHHKNKNKKSRYVDGELLVKYKKKVSTQRKESNHRKRGHRKIRELKSIGVDHVRLKEGTSVEEAVKAYNADPDVEYAEPDYLLEPMAVPNDELYPSLWGMSKINAPAAWDMTTGSSDVVVAVLDSGIDYNHPDLAPNVWPGIGYNAVDLSSNPIDNYGHGTHVAGTIGAVGNNGSGVVGVNWDVGLLACKMGDSSFPTSNSIKCLDYIRNLKDQGVNIVATNNSYGGTNYSQAMYDAIAAQQDILFIAAAGNDSTNNDETSFYPAGYDLPNVISVAATGTQDNLEFFSNFGERTVTLGAPGININSTYLDLGYAPMLGTSMAAPHVTGLAALLKAQDPTRDWRAIKNLILAGAQNVPGLLSKTVTGRRIDAYGSAACTDSPLFIPIELPVQLEPGTPIDFRYLSINCADPVGPVNVTTSAGGTFVLKDDGVAPDQAAGDGIFRGTWTPSVTTERFTFESPLGSKIQRIPALIIDTASLPNAALDNPYHYEVPVTGGLPPYSAFAIVSGALPDGVFFDTINGEFTGTPTVTGHFSVTIEVTDAEQVTIRKALNLTVFEGGVLEERVTIVPDGSVVPKLVTDSMDNLYAARYVGSTLHLDKYSPTGALLWNQSYETGVVSSGIMVLVDVNDDVIVSYGPAFLVKFTSQGTVAWGQQITGYTGLPGFLPDRDGNYRLIGRTDSGTISVLSVDYQGNLITSWDLQGVENLSMFVEDSAGNLLIQSRHTDGNNNMGILLQKFDPAGTLLWSSIYNHALLYEYSAGIDIDAEDNVYLLGTAASYYPDLAFLLKYDPSGIPLWEKKIIDFEARDLEIASDGNLYLTGGFHDFVTHDRTLITASYDSDGNELWTAMDDQSPFYAGYSMALDNLGHLYVSASDKLGTYKGIITYSIVFHIPSTTLPPASVGLPYSSQVQAIGGVKPLVWSITEGSLPEGLDLDPVSGTISGTPVLAGNYPLSLQVSDATGQLTFKVVTLNVYDPPVMSSVLPYGLQGVSYNESLSLTGGLAPYTWALTSGVLPDGLTLSSSGVLTGTPTTLGDSTFTISVTDSIGVIDSKTLTMSIHDPVIMATTSLASSPMGAAYQQDIVVTGGVVPYTWSVVSGALPAEFTLGSASGSITGTPVVTGTSTFTVQVADAAGVIVSQEYSIVVYDPLRVSVTPTSTAQANVVYTSSFQAENGVPSYSWELINGTQLPPGLTLNSSTGALTGTPTALGTYPATVQVTDSSGATDLINFVIDVEYLDAVISPSWYPRSGRYLATVNRPFSVGMTASNGLPPFSWSLAADAPAGLSIDSVSGLISGAPTIVGQQALTVLATDASQTEVTWTYDVSVMDDASLTEDWSNLYTPVSGTTSYRVAGTVTDSVGNVYVAASVRRTAYNDYLVELSKFSPGGVLQWSKTYQAAFKKNAYAASITIDQNDVVYVSGSQVNTDGSTVGMVIKYDLNGNPSVVETLASTTNLNALTVDGTGNILVAGGTTVTKYSAAWDAQFTVPMSYTVDKLETDPLGNVLVCGGQTVTKLDSNGGQLWELPSLVSGGGSVNAIKSDSSGNVYVASDNYYKIRISKIDAAGVVLWEHDSALDNTKGQSGRSIDLQLKNNRLAIFTSTMYWGGKWNDALLAVYSTNGDLLGAMNFDDGGSEFHRGVALDDFGNLYLAIEGSSYSGNFKLAKYNFGLDILTGRLPSAVNGVGYSQTLQASNGTLPYTWSLIGGALPSGVNLDSATGELSGPPAAAGVFDFTVQVSDSDGGQSTQEYTLTVNEPLVFTTTDLPVRWVNHSSSLPLPIAGGVAPYSVTVVDGTLPAGLSLSGHFLRGSATEAGSSTFTLQISDQDGQSITQTLTQVVAVPGPMVFESGAAPEGAIGDPYLYEMSASGGVSPYTWNYVYSALPPGLSLDWATGIISGVPTEAGTFYTYLWIHDSLGTRLTKSLSITIKSDLAFIGGAFDEATVGLPYNQPLTATGGVAPYSWSTTGAPLTAGLTIDSSTGTISGIPEASGTASFIVRVTDSAGGDVRVWCSIKTLKNFEVDVSSLPVALTGTPYSQALTATGGTLPYTWSVTSGTMPPGLSLNGATGQITGAPTVSGPYSFAVQVIDDDSDVATADFSIDVQLPLTIDQSSTVFGTFGQLYSQALTASGGSGTYTWSLSSGVLPIGLSLDPATGAISGTPAESGSFNFTLQVNDGVNAPVSVALSLMVYDPLSIVPVSLPTGIQGDTYSQSLTATGGLAPYSWSVVAGSLPAGLNVNASNGVISGTPSAAGTFDFTLQVTDANASVTTTSLTLTVYDLPIITNPLLATGIFNTPYSHTLTATAGLPPYIWAISSGQLPDGLTLDSASGEVLGTPRSSGFFDLTLTVTDARQVATTINTTLLINGGQLSGVWSDYNRRDLEESGDDIAVDKDGYTYVAGSADGSCLTIKYDPAGNVVWRNTYPNGYATGVAVDALGNVYVNANSDNGTESGLLIKYGPSGTLVWTTPHSSGFSAKGVGIDAAGNVHVASTTVTGYRVVKFDTVGNVLWDSTYDHSGTSIYATGIALDADGNIYVNGRFHNGTEFDYLLVKFTSLGSMEWAETDSQGSMDLSTGIAVSKQGNIYATGYSKFSNFMMTTRIYNPAGTLLWSGSYNGGNTKTFANDIVVDDDGNFYLVGHGNPDGAQGLTYNLRVVKFDPAGNVVWDRSENLPTVTPKAYGVALDSTGDIYVTGAFYSQQDYYYKLLTIKFQQFLIGTASLPVAAPGGFFSQALMAGGGAEPYSWSVTSGMLPEGTTLDEVTGVLSGTPLTAGSFPFTIQVVDAIGVTTSKPFTMNVYDPLAVSMSALPAGEVGGAYSQQMTAVGGLAPYTWSATGLPVGLAIDPSTGMISGTSIEETGSFTVTVSVTDTAIGTRTRNLTIDVYGQLNVQPVVMPVSEVGGAYSQQLTAVGGLAPYTWGATGLPAALSLNPGTGLISGSTEVAGSFTVTVSVTDSAIGTRTRDVVIDVYDQLNVQPVAMPVSEVGAAYSQQLTATGGLAPYAWSATGLPTALSLDPATGLISGSTEAAGSFAVTVTVTDSVIGTRTRDLTINVYEQLNVQVVTMPVGEVGGTYSQQLIAAGGLAPYTWSATGLPVGLNIDPATGVISGTSIEEIGSFTVTASVTDSAIGTRTRDLTIDVYGQLNVQAITMPVSEVGGAYSQQLTAIGGLLPYTWSATGLPSALSLDPATGLIGGSTEVAGSFTVTVSVTDSAIGTRTRDIVIDVYDQLNVQAVAMPVTEVDAAYSQQLTAAGGLSPYSWGATGLPFALRLDPATGLISGSAEVAGSFTVTVSVTDSAIGTRTRDLIIDVYPQLTISAISLADGIVAGGYSQTATAQGGTLSYTWSATGLPAGVSINNSTGEISGTPQVAGIFNVTLQVVDTGIGSASRVVSLLINDDVDRDGFDETFDCDDNDPTIYPGAPEVIGDGIDQDCNGYDLSIVVTRSRYDADKEELSVRATSDYADTANLELEGYGPMTWKADKSRWELKIKDITQPPSSTRVFGPEGEIVSTVTIK